MKKKLSLFLTVFFLGSSFLMIPARAEDTLPEGSTPTTNSSEESKPSEPSNPSEESKPTESTPTESTQPTHDSTPTQPSEPKPCTHVYGEWTADEAAHGRKCTLCGYAESNAHTWASDTVTVDPTCGEAGGECKICTVCQGVLVTKLIEPTGKHTFDNSCDAKCNVCGAERTVEHTFGTGWKYSGKGHWHYCTICGAAGEVKDHYPGPAATEEKEQICLTCGMVMMKKKAHTHKWDTQWSSDEAGHWYTCTVCQEKDKMTAPTYDDSCDIDGSVCGYVRTAAHTYGPDWMQTELSHYGICTVCGEETPAENHVTDSTGKECSICGYDMEAAEETHVHEFMEDTWGFDEAGHWNVCMCGEKDKASPHTWDEGVKDGKQILHTCGVCGSEKTEEAPKSSFPWLQAAVGSGVLICLAGIAICIVLIIRNRRYEE